MTPISGAKTAAGTVYTGNAAGAACISTGSLNLITVTGDIAIQQITPKPSTVVGLGPDGIDMTIEVTVLIDHDVPVGG
jgi:hypothetical protein